MQQRRRLADSDDEEEEEEEYEDEEEEEEEDGDDEAVARRLQSELNRRPRGGARGAPSRATRQVSKARPVRLAGKWCHSIRPGISRPQPQQRGFARVSCELAFYLLPPAQACFYVCWWPHDCLASGPPAANLCRRAGVVCGG